jgi:hypothetical protein
MADVVADIAVQAPPAPSVTGTKSGSIIPLSGLWIVGGVLVP